MRKFAKRKPAKRTKSKIITPRRLQDYMEGSTTPWLKLSQDAPSPPPPTAAETLTARQSTHGDFSENARVMQQTKRVLRSGANWMGDLRIGSTAINGLYAAALSDVQAEAIEMIVVKLGRIVTGDPNHADSWLDIEGYARLARERLS